MPKLIRVTTVPMALRYLLPGQMKYMKQQGFDVIMVSADGKERQAVIDNEGCEHHIIPMTRKITPFADLKSWWKMYRYFKKEKPDIVHSHTPKAGLIAMTAARMAGVKIRIHTVAGLRFMTSTGTTRKILVKMEKLTAGAATHVWPNSQSLLNYIKTNKLAKEKKLQVIGYGSSNGINLARFSPTALQPAKVEETKQLIKYDKSFVYLLCVGRIVKDKGIDELLAAFENIYKERNDLRLVLLGSFEDELDPISDNARKILKEHPGIIHISWSDHVEYFMHLANMLVHPSYREGFPNVLLQSGALNCPIVCSRIEGNVDIVDDGQTGLICEVKDAASLEARLRFAIGNPLLMGEYAAALRNKIEQQFDQRFVHESLKNKYLELIKGVKV
ncbi:MAG TPA: glycosyltransferase family 4 protein [Chitinophagaceae bacterium]|jgi:glycosyltransferase involved in cell wall biosynthesis|nr:glycosyltransferase family 4 protein [Chitinophagaceae bacterium]